MKNIHLTDEEIQQYAFDANSCSQITLGHIQQCAHCQQQAAQYQVLFAGIETQEKEAFDFDIADLVMAKLPKPAPAQDKSLVYVFACIIVALIGVVGYLFGSSMTNLFAYMQPLLMGLVIITSAGLMGFLGLDMYQKYKTQMEALNFS